MKSLFLSFVEIQDLLKTPQACICLLFSKKFSLLNHISHRQVGFGCAERHVSSCMWCVLRLCVFFLHLFIFCGVALLPIFCGQFVASTHEPAKAQNLSTQTHIPTSNPSSQFPMPQLNAPSPKTLPTSLRTQSVQPQTPKPHPPKPSHPIPTRSRANPKPTRLHPKQPQIPQTQNP